MQQFAALPSKKATQSSLLSGLVTWWQFGDPGNLGRDATGVNFASVTAVGLSGGVSTSLPSGGGFHFATTSNLQIPSGSAIAFSPGSGNFTVCGWYNPSTTGSATLIGKGTIGSSLAGSEWALGYQGGVNKRFVLTVTPVANCSVTRQANTATNTASGLNQWYFAVAWYDGANLNLSLNNAAAVQTAYTSGVFVGGFPLRIGRDSNGNATPDAIMTGLGYWLRALTSTERTNLFNSGNGASYPFTGL